MNKCIDEDTVNSIINRYLKRRNYTVSYFKKKCILSLQID